MSLAGSLDHDVVILGAGMSGIAMGAALMRAGRPDFLILEEAEGIGGTWWHNRYPGAQCDVPSHLYCFSFAPNPNWSRVYASGDEIQRYAADCVERFGLGSHLRLGTRIESAIYDVTAKRWRIRTQRGEVLSARHFVASMGPLHRPRLPEGIEAFEGPVLHTARWDALVTLTGRRVAIVGSAASAVQVIPAIAPAVAHLDVYQRTPSWVIPRGDRPYPPWLRRCLGVSFIGRLYRWALYLGTEAAFPAFRLHGLMPKILRWIATRHLRMQVADLDLRTQLTPDYPAGCKRVLLSDSYYPALQQPNVRLHGKAAGFAATGVVDSDGSLHPADVVICATGFDTLAPLAGVHIQGPAGDTLAQRWARGPEAYHGTVVDGFPNFWLLLGPNTGTGHTSVLIPIEAQADYIVRCLGEIESRHATSMAIRHAALIAHNEDLQRRLSKTVWASPRCASWYKAEDGRVLGTFPGYLTQYRYALRHPDFSDYVFE